MENEDLLIRAIDWHRDGNALKTFDASFETKKIYRLVADGFSSGFREEDLAATFVKKYDLSEIGSAFAESEFGLIAEVDGEAAGFALVKFEKWNRRTWLTHLYIAPKYKGRGIGTVLLDRSINHARWNGGRGIWLETQNVNYPAIHFYLKAGFRFCGFDSTIYEGEASAESALFFCIEF